MHPMITAGAYAPPAVPAQPATAIVAPGGVALAVDGPDTWGTDPIERAVIDGTSRNPDQRPTLVGTNVPVSIASPGPVAVRPAGVESRTPHHPAGPRTDTLQPWPNLPGNAGLKALVSTPVAVQVGAATDPRPELGNSWRAAPAPWDSAYFVGYVPVS